MIELKSNELQLLSINNEIEKKLGSVYNNYKKNYAMLNIEKRNFKTAEKIFEKNKQLFFQGQISKVDFRLAQTQLRNSENNLNKIQYSVKILELNLLMLSGNIINEIDK